MFMEDEQNRYLVTLLPGLVAGGILLVCVALRYRYKKPANGQPGIGPKSSDQLVQTCIDRIKEEFADRIPIVDTFFSRYVVDQQRLEIWYLVKTAAIEDSIRNDIREALRVRTRDELLYSGYFRDRHEAVSTRVASEERLEKHGIRGYIY